MQRFFDREQEQRMEQLIQNVFYNSLLDIVLNHQPNRQNIDQVIQQAIAQTITNLINASKNHPGGIALPTGHVVTRDQCPVKYRDLFAILINLKSTPATPMALQVIAGRIMALESFQAFNPKQFILEATGQASPVAARAQYDETGVTPALIRETFYNEMVAQTLLATDNKWLLITKEDLVDMESHIYMALPGLTILEAIQQSQNCTGIRLLYNKELTTKSCPQTEGFPELVHLILTVKNRIKKLTDDEVVVVKHVLSCNKELPDNLQHLATPELMATLAIIKDMAIEISRRGVFQKMIVGVINMCVESLNQSPRANLL